MYTTYRIHHIQLEEMEMPTYSTYLNSPFSFSKVVCKQTDHILRTGSRTPQSQELILCCLAYPSEDCRFNVFLTQIHTKIILTKVQVLPNDQHQNNKHFFLDFLNNLTSCSIHKFCLSKICNSHSNHLLPAFLGGKIEKKTQN